MVIEKQTNTNCGRCGGKCDNRHAIKSTHSALMILVCPPCQAAHNMWTSMHITRKSKLRSVKVNDPKIYGGT